MEISRSGGTNSYPIILVELEADGIKGFGEAAPSGRYKESIQLAQEFFERIDAARLKPDDLEGTGHYLEEMASDNMAARGALDMALLDIAGQQQGKPIHDLFSLGFREATHITSFSIGIDSAEIIKAKVAEASRYPILKLKVGVSGDRENLAALREAAPLKRVRVDANEAWKTKEEALRNLELLAADGQIEFVEQPMPSQSRAADLKWLKERSPLPLMADESYRSAADIPMCADLFHSVNVKLVKAGGITKAHAALQAARSAGLKTMLGCMIESSVLITAAAHLAELTDYLDLDGNLLTSNDPCEGVRSHDGTLSFVGAPGVAGLRARPRN